MHSSFLSVLALAFASTSFSATIPNEKRTLRSTSGNQTIITQLTNAPTGLDRINILRDNDDFKYDFLNPPTAPTTRGNATGLGGHTITANRGTMPGLIGTGSSMTVGFLGPCGMNTPHTHPRGTELNIVVQGSLVTTFIGENNARVVQNTNTLYQMSVFPRGAMHQEFNPGCGSTVFIAAFDNEDAATLQTADNLFRMDNNIVKAAMGGEVIVDGRNIDAFRTMIPANVAKGVDECLARCNIRKRSLDEIARLEKSSV